MKKSKYLIILILVVIFSFIITNTYVYNSKYNGNENTISGVIYDYNIDGDKLTLYLKAKEKIVCNYYFNSEKEKNYYIKNIKHGYTVNLEGSLSTPNNNTVPNLFNYKKYLYNKKIYWIFNINKINIISKNNNIFYKIKDTVINKINAYKYSKNYLYAFILGDTSKIDYKILKSYQNNGISHLFAISGMHIAFLTGILIFILKKIKLNDYIINIIMFLFLLFYIFLTGFTSSILRASLFFILLKLNKTFNVKINTLNILFLTISILLVINSFLIYDLGFQYSCAVSISLIYFSNLIKGKKTYLGKIFITSLIAFLVGLPISIYNFFHINILSCLINLIFVPFISIIIFPFSMLTFIFPFLDFINNFLISILENISLIISNIKFFDITLSKPNLLLIFIYYVTIIIFLKKYQNGNIKYIFLLIIIMFLHHNFAYFNSNMYMIMIDVGQGDSILIVLPHNKGNILIDTGGKINYSKESWQTRNKNYSIADNTLIPLFKSFGINKLDYLILTHGDYDHAGETINLIDNYKIDNIIFNNDNYNELEQNIIENLKNKNINYYNNLKEINIDKYKLQFLNTKEYNNENDNSNVIYFNYNNYKFLFMGDAGIEKEEDLLEEYNINDIDFLKVGHHGSNTSSSKRFISSINPKYSLISVGKNNKYGHPNKEVLDILSKSKIYRTDLDGSITLKFKNIYKIETCEP